MTLKCLSRHALLEAVYNNSCLTSLLKTTKTSESKTTLQKEILWVLIMLCSQLSWLLSDVTLFLIITFKVGKKLQICCRSGSAEDFNEKIRLLQDMSDLKESSEDILAARREEMERKKKEATEKLKKKQKDGADIRVQTMRALKQGLLKLQLT